MRSRSSSPALRNCCESRSERTGQRKCADGPAAGLTRQKALNESVGSKKETMPFLLANTSPAVERNRRHARQNDMPRRSKHDEYSSVMRQRETLSPSPVNCQNVTFTPPYAATGGAGTIDRGLVNSKPGPTGSVGASSASNNVPNSPYRWSKMLFTKP